MGHPCANFCFSVTFPFHPYTDGRKGGEVRERRHSLESSHHVVFMQQPHLDYWRSCACCVPHAMQLQSMHLQAALCCAWQ